MLGELKWCGGDERLTAARRMKGVVRPQASPTRRKPRVERKREGGGDDGDGVASISSGSRVESRVGGKGN